MIGNWTGNHSELGTFKGYPLVNIQKTMERSTIFHGKIHYFYGHFPLFSTQSCHIHRSRASIIDGGHIFEASIQGTARGRQIEEAQLGVEETYLWRSATSLVPWWKINVP